MTRKLRSGVFLVLTLFFAMGVAQAGDAFLKGGFILSPSGDADLSERYLIDFGSDYPVGDVVGLGWEIATAYYRIEFAEKDIHKIPLNGFFNMKLMGPVEGVRPFAKAGIGMINTFFGGELTDSVSNFGLHFTGGAEFGSREGAAFVVELQGEQAFDEDAPFTWIFLAGIKF